MMVWTLKRKEEKKKRRGVIDSEDESDRDGTCGPVTVGGSDSKVEVDLDEGRAWSDGRPPKKTVKPCESSN